MFSISCHNLVILIIANVLPNTSYGFLNGNCKVHFGVLTASGNIVMNDVNNTEYNNPPSSGNSSINDDVFHIKNKIDLNGLILHGAITVSHS